MVHAALSSQLTGYLWYMLTAFCFQTNIAEQDCTYRTVDISNEVFKTCSGMGKILLVVVPVSLGLCRGQDLFVHGT